MPSLRISRVIHEHIPLQLTDVGQTVGEQVDVQIARYFKEGSEGSMQEIAIEFGVGELGSLANRYLNSRVAAKAR